MPFNSLPPELLIHIFVRATLDTFHPIRLRLDTIPLTISHVCQRWRDIALSTPTLWRRIVLIPSDLFPRVSQGLPLRLFSTDPRVFLPRCFAPYPQARLTTRCPNHSHREVYSHSPFTRTNVLTKSARHISSTHFLLFVLFTSTVPTMSSLPLSAISTTTRPAFHL